MTAKTDSIQEGSPKTKIIPKSLGGAGFDWLIVALSTWFIGGIFLDGWAHNHGRVDESFFTPWHGVLYSGYLVVAGVLVVTLIKNLVTGVPFREALPEGYRLSFMGMLVFGAGGVGDMAWHTLFGIEEGVDALLSPTHLLLGLGSFLMLTGPVRAFWRRSHYAKQENLIALLPMLLSVAFGLSLLTFFTMYGHPISEPLAGREHQFGSDFLNQALGATSVLLQSGVLMGFILIIMRRWKLPFGSFFVLFAVNAFAQSFLHFQENPMFLVVAAAALAGLAGDALYRWLEPSFHETRSLRWFAFLVPTINYALYFLALNAVEGIWWSVHLWTGLILLSGGIGLALSYLVSPPVIPFAHEQSI